MRSVIRRLVLTTLAVLLATTPVLAAKGKPAGSAKGPRAKVQAAAKTKAPKAKTQVKAFPAKGSSVKVAKATAPKSPKATSTKISRKTPSPTAGFDGTPWAPTNAVAQKAFTKPNLMTKVQTLLPGTDLNAATAGFKNFGQFNAAVNASTNLGIPFADLKAAMTGITIDGLPTGQPVLSLGQAKQTLRPGVEATTATRKTPTMVKR